MTSTVTPCWLALATDKADHEVLQCLTTRLMAWGEGVWLLDLAPFLSYWQRQARSRRHAVPGLWRDVLYQVFGGRSPEDKVVAMHVPFQAVLADHPAEALLLLYHMKARRLTGLVIRSTDFGRQLFDDVPWESFWMFAEDVASHGRRLKLRGWGGSWTAEWERCKRAMARLGIMHPRSVRHVKPAAMHRRFGKRLGLLWEWCWFPRERAGAQEFPWEDWHPSETVRVTTHLEHAVFSWQEMEPWLRSDLDRLASLCGDSRIAKLAWQLRLSNLEAVMIPVAFRHPHRLREEAGEQMTALLQAKYAFEAFCMSRGSDIPASEIQSYPVSWDVTVESMLSLPPILKDIFHDVMDGHSDEDGLAQLENELPIPLRRYALREDWVPEDSFQEGLAAGPVEGHWHEAARKRPLFLYEEARPFSSRAHQAFFVETVMSKWWRERTQEEGERHYFRLLSDKEETLWVYRNGKGQWWVHGVFG